MNHSKLIVQLLCLCGILALFSCGKPQSKKHPLDNLTVLSQALAKEDTETIQLYIDKVRLTENSQNLISLYTKLETDSILQLHRQTDYLHQFYPQMKFIHQSMFNEMLKWVLLNIIYRDEIAPPVRIFQREKMYLAPSHIDFEVCLADSAKCSESARIQLKEILTNEEITEQLKKMAKSDPCVNMGNTLEDEFKADRCLKRTQGQLVVKLLKKPEFTMEEWLQALKQQ